MPRDFKAALQSSRYKSALLSFVAGELSRDKYREDLSGHILYVSCGTVCFVYTAKGKRVTRDKVPTMENTHEEVDTCIVLHLKHANDLNPQSVAVM